MPKTIDRSHNPTPLLFTREQLVMIKKALVIYRSDFAVSREKESLPVIEEILAKMEGENA